MILCFGRKFSQKEKPRILLRDRGLENEKREPLLRMKPLPHPCPFVSSPPESPEKMSYLRVECKVKISGVDEKADSNVRSNTWTSRFPRWPTSVNLKERNLLFHARLLRLVLFRSPTHDTVCQFVHAHTSSFGETERIDEEIPNC